MTLRSTLTKSWIWSSAPFAREASKQEYSTLFTTKITYVDESLSVGDLSSFLSYRELLKILRCIPYCFLQREPWSLSQGIDWILAGKIRENNSNDMPKFIRLNKKAQNAPLTSLNCQLSSILTTLTSIKSLKFMKQQNLIKVTVFSWLIWVS